ncbi:hypothetical protein [Amycolatopsis sp. EV170708-02-1]|nr:hypothetical protein [Amycolatopsis sp. EV170708-02-1]
MTEPAEYADVVVIDGGPAGIGRGLTRAGKAWAGLQTSRRTS